MRKSCKGKGAPRIKETSDDTSDVAKASVDKQRLGAEPPKQSLNFGGLEELQGLKYFHSPYNWSTSTEYSRKEAHLRPMNRPERTDLVSSSTG